MQVNLSFGQWAFGYLAILTMAAKTVSQHNTSKCCSRCQAESSERRLRYQAEKLYFLLYFLSILLDKKQFKILIELTDLNNVTECNERLCLRVKISN